MILSASVFPRLLFWMSLTISASLSWQDLSFVNPLYQSACDCKPALLAMSSLSIVFLMTFITCELIPMVLMSFGVTVCEPVLLKGQSLPTLMPSPILPLFIIVRICFIKYSPQMGDYNSLPSKSSSTRPFSKFVSLIPLLNIAIVQINSPPYSTAIFSGRSPLASINFCVAK
jgi:hypothetical protein